VLVSRSRDLARIMCMYIVFV